MAEERSRGRIFLEDVMRIRVKGKPSDTSQLPNTAGTPADLVNTISMLDKADGISTNLADLQDFRSLSSDAETRYRIFDEMEMDSVISSALDMYADDATQYNVEGKVIWAESEDSDVAKFANRLIDAFQLNTNSWSYIRSLVKYGDLYLELFRDDETGDILNPYGLDEVDGNSMVKIYRPKIGSTLEEYIEKVENPAVVYEISKKGKIVGYIKTKENDINSVTPKYHYQQIQIQEDDILMPSDKYVHIYLPNNDRFQQTVDIELTPENGETRLVRYKVNRGKSILHDLYKAYKELKLMEDALLLNRVTRSSIIRMLQIEVGDMPKSQAQMVLKRFKNIIEQKNFLDKQDGTFSSQASPGPIDNCIYIPTYNGKGAVTATNLGGDVDVKSIVDLDYFREKLAGGLKIPLSYISGTSQENGLGGGTSLTKIDARYARTIKRVQNAYIQGVTNLINIFAVNCHLTDHINNFTIKMVSPSTMEDAERNEDLANNIDISQRILDLLGVLEQLSPEATRDILVHLMSNYLKEPEIADIIENDKLEDDEEDEGGVDFGGRSGGGSPGLGGMDLGGGEPLDDIETNDTIDTEANDTETETDNETGAEPNDFGNYEFAYGEEI